MHALKRLLYQLVARSVSRPAVPLVVVALLVVLSAGIAVLRFEMTTDTAELISSKVQWRQQEQAMDSAFPQLGDAMVILIDGATPELAQHGADQLAARLAGDSKHFRRVQQADGGDFFAREGLLFQSEDEVRKTLGKLVDAQPLLGPLAADPSLRGVASAISNALDGVDAGDTKLSALRRPFDALAAATEQALAGKPVIFSWERLFSADEATDLRSRRRLVLAQPVLDPGELQPGGDAQEAVRAAARSLKLAPERGVTVRMTGEVPLADEEFGSIEENFGLIGLLLVVSMVAILWIATRSARQVTSILVTMCCGLVMTTALGLLSVGRFNLISIAFIPLFVGLGVDFGIQICVRFNAERAKGASADEALRSTASGLGSPLLLAAGAILLGFLAFLPTAYVGIAELGVIAAIGIAVALALSLTMLPALLMLAPGPLPSHDVAVEALGRAGTWLDRKRSLVLGAFGFGMIGSIALLPLVSFDFNPLHLRNPNGPAMRALADLTQDPDRTPNTIDVLARNAAEAASLSRRLRQLPEVADVVDVNSFVPADQPRKLALIEDAATLLDPAINPLDIAAPAADPDVRAALGQLSGRLIRVAAASRGPEALSARRLGVAFGALARASSDRRRALNEALSLPLEVMLNSVRNALQAEPVSRETLPPDLRRDWIAPDGRMRLQVMPSGNANDNKVLEKFREAVSGVTPAVSGLPVVSQAAAATVALAFVQAGVIAFLLVSLLLFGVLRSVRHVLFTLAPVVLSIFLTLGSCVLIGQSINFANIIAFPLLFGVGVAFHIYFVMAWRAGTSGLLHTSLARGVLFSALATGTAFGTLWLSHHPGTASMGKILMISLLWTLVCALVFEPALLGPARKQQAARH